MQVVSEGRGFADAGCGALRILSAVGWLQIQSSNSWLTRSASIRFTHFSVVSIFWYQAGFCVTHVSEL